MTLFGWALVIWMGLVLAGAAFAIIVIIKDYKEGL